MAAITDLIRPSRATRKVETLMVLSPLTTSLPKLLLRPGRWTVGSAATCSYRIVAEGVRPRHALLLCGGQTTLLKAWDSHTWHNGQPVRGEVRLQEGDRVTVGSVELSVESQPGVPDPGREGTASAQSTIATPPEPDGRDLERLRGQIQNLRDELSQRVSRRTVAIPAPPPIAATHPDVERMSARVAELEQSAIEDRQLAEQTQQELSALRAEQAQRNAEWQHARDQLLAESAEREHAWQQQADAWGVEHEQWQDELLSLANARQQLATKLEQRESELQTEATRWRTECEVLRADRQQQIAAQEVEREQYQQELESLTQARQQLAAEFEQRQSELKKTATGWQTKCETLHADWQRQQAGWAEERKQLLEESQRQKVDVAQQISQAAAQREQEWSEQSQQLLAERQQIESERRTLQATRLDLEQALAELSAERQRIADHAAEVLSKSEEHTRRMAEVEQQQAQLARDQQVLEHSRNWVQSDRRRLVEEKTEWQQQCAERQTEREGWEAEREQQRLLRDELEKARGLCRDERDATQQLAVEREQLTAERDQLTAERDQLTAERAAWMQQRAQSETEQQTNSTQFEAAYAELQTQQQTLHNERAQLQTLRADWDARAAEVQVERQAVDPEPQAFSEDRGAWENDRTAWGTDLPSAVPDSGWGHQPTLAEEPSQSLTDDWSIGVDLTAPREMPGAEPLFEPAAVSDWPTTSITHPLTEATSLDQVSDSETSAPAAEWDIPSQARELNGFVNAEEPRTPASESPPETATDRPRSVMETLDDDVAALRAELAEKFDLPGLRETLPETLIVDEPTADELIAGEQVVDETVNDAPVVVEASIVEPVESPNSGSPVNILGSLAFADDENVDDSVSRYMQHLLARSQRPSENGSERFVPASTQKSPGTEPTRPTPAASLISVAEIEINAESDSSEVESPSSAKLRALQAEPAHRQDKDAVRAATEKMRQVANQQTFNNVRASNSNRLKRSLKMKSSLAVFSFVLSAGLLFLGYSYQPDFLVLGVCAGGLGVMTWVDLFIAIREARNRTSQLAGRKKKA